MSEIFKDLLSDNDISNVKKNLYPEWIAENALKTNVRDAKIGLADLINAVRDSHNCISHTDSYSWIDNTKKEFDSIAYLLEKFIQEFKPMYEEVVTRHVAETLAKDEKEANFDLQNKYITVDGLNVMSGTFNANNITASASTPLNISGNAWIDTSTKQPGWKKAK